MKTHVGDVSSLQMAQKLFVIRAKVFGTLVANQLSLVSLQGMNAQRPLGSKSPGAFVADPSRARALLISSQVSPQLNQGAIHMFASKAFQHVVVVHLDLFRVLFLIIIDFLAVLVLALLNASFFRADNDQVFGHVRQNPAASHALFIMATHVLPFRHGQTTLDAFPAIISLDVTTPSTPASRQFMHRPFLIVVVI